MSRIYLGHLSADDPLYDYFKYEIQPQLSSFRDYPDYRVFRLNGSNAVYLYEEAETGAKIIGKFFYSERCKDRASAARQLEREYANLEMMRGYGFDREPFYVAKPLGRNSALGELLSVEYCEGELLSSIISRAIREKNDSLLFDKLGVLARFFAEFHNRTAGNIPVDFNRAGRYMDRVVHQCGSLLKEGEADTFYALRDVWHDRPEMWQDCQVMVHGDATPENFMFGDGENLKTFDLERCMASDRIFDIGRIAGELKHFFLMEADDGYAAEPFIGHFLWEYATRFPDREMTFYSITRRVPFYMGMTLLRIARNFWIDRSYRRRLIYQAENCFRGEKL